MVSKQKGDKFGKKHHFFPNLSPVFASIEPLEGRLLRYIYIRKLIFTILKSNLNHTYAYVFEAGRSEAVYTIQFNTWWYNINIDSEFNCWYDDDIWKLQNRRIAGLGYSKKDKVEIQAENQKEPSP